MNEIVYYRSNLNFCDKDIINRYIGKPYFTFALYFMKMKSFAFVIKKKLMFVDTCGYYQFSRFPLNNCSENVCNSFIGMRACSFLFSVLIYNANYLLLLLKKFIVKIIFQRFYLLFFLLYIFFTSYSKLILESQQIKILINSRNPLFSFPYNISTI